MYGGLWHSIENKDQDHSQEKEMQKKKNECLKSPYQ